ncbi:MAG: phosphonate ABC transporter, permease protein PhnE [Erysipelotrichaceae bacterium]|jgi:phosphonate transport system permease protein|nr:phosphonate ABC transporter, permease protein PhnE [Erysipelotrichaceae bacterium]
MENKVSLFDRIFKPEHIVLANGHSVDRPKSRVPLIATILLVVIAFSIYLTEFNIATVVERFEQFFVILGKIFHPDFSYFENVVGPLFDTIKMSLMGSITGCVLALPFAVLASSNINKNKPILLAVRFVLGLIRTIPTIILATVFGLIFGLGTFAGTVAIVIFTFGVVGKMLFESIETIDLRPFEALESLGCNKFQAFWTACIPQILPTYLSHCLYCFEMNVRAAAILGYVGAGGLGILINERIGWRDYNGLGMVLLTLFVTVLIIDQVSTRIRRKLS